MSRFAVEKIGDATLYLGDAADVLPSLSGINCTVTSPPYNQMTAIPSKPSGLWAKSHGGLGFVNRWNGRGYSDNRDEAEYQVWQNEIFAAVAACSSPTASLFYNHQLRWRDGECLHPIAWFRPEGWRLRTEIIWDRAGGMMLNARMFVRVDERILWFVRGQEWKWNQDHVGLGTIWKVAREQRQQGDKEHPVAYPLDLPHRCIGATTDAGDTVLDPFMGSASTGVAALKLGRKFVGVEIDQTYFDNACRRIEQAWKQPRLFEEPNPKAEQLDLIGGAS